MSASKSKATRPSLSSTLIVRSVSMALAAVACTGLTVVLSMLLQYRQELYSTQYILTHSTAETVDMFFDRPQDFLRELGEQLHGAEDPAASLQGFGPGVVERTSYIDAMVLLDSTGLVTAAVPSASYPVGYDMSAMDAVQPPFPRWDMRIALDGVSVQSRQPQLLLTLRLDDGYLIASFNMDTVTGILHEVIDTETAQIAVVDGSGVFAVHSDHTHVEQQAREPLYPQLYRSGEYQPLQEFVQRDGRMLMLSAHPILGGSWSVVTYRELRPFIQHALTALWHGLLALAAALLLFGSLAYRRFRRAVQPIAAITESLRGFADGDYARRLSGHGYQEFAVVAQQFNRMADRISDSRQQLTREIDERAHAEETLQATVAEKDSLLQELHHRVKNNLQIMSSLLNLQIMRVEEPRQRLLLQNVRLKLLSLSMVHEQIYLSPSFSQIDIAEFLRDLVAVVQHELKPSNMNLSFVYDLPPLFLQVDKATTVSILLNELLSNVVLHAYPDGRDGTVEITLSSEEQWVRFRLRDDGVGLSESVSPESPTSLGLTLVQSLTTQLRGRVRFTRLYPGTEVLLQFPIG